MYRIGTEGCETDRTRHTVFLGLLTAAALSLFLVESLIPIPIPVAGVKLGLANIVTLAVLWCFGARDALTVLLLRCALGSLFSGQLISLLYSLTGGLLSLLVMLLARRLVTERQIFVLSILGGIAHNVGQIAVAVAVTGTPGILIYLPVLLLAGLLAGAFTGLCAQFLIPRLEKLR